MDGFFISSTNIRLTKMLAYLEKKWCRKSLSHRYTTHKVHTHFLLPFSGTHSSIIQTQLYSTEQLLFPNCNFILIVTNLGECI